MKKDVSTAHSENCLEAACCMHVARELSKRGDGVSHVKSQVSTNLLCNRSVKILHTAT